MGFCPRNAKDGIYTVELGQGKMMLLIVLILICFVFFISRLERLQRIVTKVQMESGTCDTQLSHLEALLQTVSPTKV